MMVSWFYATSFKNENTKIIFMLTEIDKKDDISLVATITNESAPKKMT